MQAHKPPIRIVVPGRVYRRDDLDLTHTPAFGQIEGAGRRRRHLAGRSQGHARGVRARDVRADDARPLPPSFFPYTEPSAEIDISCWQCDGAAARCARRPAGSRLGGCGMVHPAVFEAVGYDAERYTGFAWGIGIERIAILQLPGRRHPAVLRERPALPRAVSDCSDATLVLRGCVTSCDVIRRSAEEIADDARRCADSRSRRSSRCRRRRRGDRFRGDRESARLPERDGPRARSGDGVRPAVTRRRTAPAARPVADRRTIGAPDASRSTTRNSCPRYAAPSPTSTRRRRRRGWRRGSRPPASVRSAPSSTSRTTC